MPKASRRKQLPPPFSLLARVAQPPGGAAAPAPRRGPRRVDVLQRRVAELEAQNKILLYSNAAAEGASERFEALFASVPLALMVIDEHDMVIQGNAKAQRMFQPGERDRPLISLMPFVSRGHMAKVTHGFAEARRAGHSEVSEVVFSMGDSGAITGDLHISRIDTRHASGEAAVQFICAVVDQGPLLAERRALQQSAMALQERNEQLFHGERRLEAVINSALDAIVCVDQHQRITVFNPTASALFQCAALDALGSPLERFLPDSAQALTFAQISTQAMLGERTARTAGGRELSVEISVSFERHATGESTTVFARDLTGRKKAEAHRAVLEAQLRESQKMQAMGTLAGGIAHDFNNILSAILGNVELARDDLGEGAPALESLEEIGKAGRRARDLVRQILTFSRNEPTQRSPVDMAEVVHETERLLRVTLPPGVELSLHLTPDVPSVMGDATQVGQALLNLCTNAVQAIGEGRGAVRVELDTATPNHRTCERLGIAPGRYAIISVSDTGAGIDSATMARIFEPFFTTKEVGKGTGLGLAVVHGVVRSHQGASDVRSTPGSGSTFTLYFPVADAVGAAPSGGDSERRLHSSIAGTGRHVMYVDDDRALVFLVERLLRRRGFRVTGFTDPREAERALRDDPRSYDLLVTDYNMPGYSGVDLVREARLIRPDLPVALASGYVTAEIETAARAEGARALIHKPNDVEELCETVQRLVMGDDGG
ncbi:PAS domain-containing hybrid sensor histidine kinase/response regulator [Xylophilus ampelinus]|uniref:histidine kinase n=1 Tax=Xylophilus ampelinus TaxID=54067 RepID=A0A318SLM0_9BURK|nr:ATP-binding protein [Xylophilus ampelinus]MCS4509078.1 ATP-binding protein [Xylophilus ampelinus]PYE79895.1 PAS domain S-box-containing protein [Xylophilus ampelinus]